MKLQMWMTWIRDRWQNRLDRAAFPTDFANDLELLAGALRSGASLTQAIDTAGSEGEGPLKAEWRRIVSEMQLGSTLQDALDGLESRLPFPAVRSFVTGVHVTHETGGSLAGMLLILAGTLRQEIAFQDRLKALTTQGKMSGYVVSGIPFFLMAMLTFMAPELMTPLYHSWLGWGIILLVVILVSIGGFVIKKITTIEV